MALRTYERQLIAHAARLSQYIGRWLPKLQIHLTAQELACVQALLTAANECLAVLVPPAEGD